MLYATQVGIKTVLTTARYYLKDQLTRRKLTDIDSDFLSYVLSKNNSNLVNTINYIYTNTSQVDPTTVYSILNYSFSLASYSAVVRGGTTDEISYTYVYTITCLGRKVNFNPPISLEVTVTGKMEILLLHTHHNFLMKYLPIQEQLYFTMEEIKEGLMRIVILQEIFPILQEDLSEVLLQLIFLL